MALIIVVLGLRLPQWQAIISMNQLGLAAASTMGNPFEKRFALQGMANVSDSGSELAFRSIIAATDNPQYAIALLDRAIQMPTVRLSWRVQLANLYMQSGRWDQAVQTLGQITEYDQVILSGCESAVIGKIRVQNAPYWCRLLQHLHQSAPESSCLVGEYLAQVGRHSDAQLAFSQATNSSNVGDDCLYRYGLYRYGREQYAEALTLYERAFSQRHLPLYLRAIGDLYAATQQPEMAMHKYQEAHTMAPQGRDCADALGGMGKVYYYYYRDYGRASSSLYQAMQCGAPLDVSVYWVLMLSERAQGHPQQAVQACDRIAKALSGSTQLLEWRHECASYFLELGRLAEAQKVYQEILLDAPDDSVAQDALEELSPSSKRIGESSPK